MKLNTISTIVILLYILPFLLHFEATQGKPLLHINTTASSTSSPWLTRLNNRRPPPGCWRQPWICNQGQVPGIRRLCCRNRCIDVSSDVNNCGLCGIRCRFTRQCCSGQCVNTNRNPFHCGRCDNRCRFPIRCMFGMCGYAQPFPPRPRPFPPRRDPPFPLPPRRGRRDNPPVVWSYICYRCSSIIRLSFGFGSVYLNLFTFIKLSHAWLKLIVMPSGITGYDIFCACTFVIFNVKVS